MKFDMIFPSLLRRAMSLLMRGRAAPFLFIGVLSVMAVVAFLLYAYGASSLLQRAGMSGGGGEALFYFLITVHVVVCACFIPLYTARRACDEYLCGVFLLLKSALLTERAIVLTKFAVAVAFGLLFIFVCAPYYVMVLLLGGVEVFEIAAGLSIVTAVPMLGTAAALYVACRAESVKQATILVGALSAALLLGMPLLVWLGSVGVRQLFGASVRASGPGLLSGLVEVVLGLLLCLSPYTAVTGGREYYLAAGDPWRFRQPIFNAISGVMLPAPHLTLSLVYVLLALLLLRSTTRFLAFGRFEK